MAPWPKRAFWNGFWNMGRPRFPLPGYVVMTDRSTGVEYYLGQEGDEGSMAVSLEHWDGSIRQPFHDYGPDGGPYLNGGKVKLFIDEETLETEAADSGISDPRIFTRDEAFGRRLIEITASEGWVAGDPLTYTETDV